MQRSLLLSSLLLATFIASTGCDGAPTAKTKSAQGANQLVALGKAYHSFHLANKKGPANWDEAIGAGDSAAITTLRDGGYVVAWGVRFRDATVGASNFVLAYHPTTLTSGGSVLMLDGAVLTAQPEPLKKLLDAQSQIAVPE